MGDILSSVQLMVLLCCFVKVPAAGNDLISVYQVM